MKFELDLKNEHASDEELIKDLIRVADSFGRKSLPVRMYKVRGRFSKTTIEKRFETWNKALEIAGLTIAQQQKRIPDIELFKNLEDLWIRLGRQPRRSDVAKPLSRFSKGVYENHFKGWNDALKAFVEYINKPEQATSTPLATSTAAATINPRGISDRMRFRVMKRDFFKCRACGRSPASDPSVILHVDHMQPWSKGGKTTEDNLQTLCSKCNLGKGNLR